MKIGLRSSHGMKNRCIISDLRGRSGQRYLQSFLRKRLLSRSNISCHQGRHVAHLLALEGRCRIEVSTLVGQGWRWWSLNDLLLLRSSCSCSSQFSCQTILTISQVVSFDFFLDTLILLHVMRKRVSRRHDWKTGKWRVTCRTRSRIMTTNDRSVWRRWGRRRSCKQLKKQSVNK